MMAEARTPAASPNGSETRLADFFKVLSCSSRICILRALLQGESSAGELAEQLGLSASSVSHQLQILRAAKLVRRRRSGKELRYSLANDSVRSMIDASMNFVEDRIDLD